MRGRLGAALPPTPPGWAARVSQTGGGRKTRRRGLRRLFTQRNGEGRSSSAPPLSAALLRGDSRAGREGTGDGFPAAAALSGAAPPLPRPPTPSRPHRILPRSRDPLAAAAGSARDRAGSATRAASSRRQSARLPLRRDCAPLQELCVAIESLRPRERPS